MLRTWAVRGGREEKKRYNKSGVGKGSRGSIQYLIYAIGVYLCMGVYLYTCIINAHYGSIYYIDKIILFFMHA